MFAVKKNELSYGRGYVYSLQYHLVWCTKYRKQLLKNGLDIECKRMLYELAEEYRFQILICGIRRIVPLPGYNRYRYLKTDMTETGKRT